MKNKERRRSRKTRKQKSTMVVFAIMHECMLVLISVKKGKVRGIEEKEKRRKTNGNPLIRT